MSRANQEKHGRIKKLALDPVEMAAEMRAAIEIGINAAAVSDRENRQGFILPRP